MQKDFHYAVTYVLCRWSDLTHDESFRIAYSCQLVDDCCDYGAIKFTNRALSSNIPSAHKPLNYKSFDTIEQYRVTLPFHFLPGNAGKKCTQEVEGAFVNKLLVRPNSYVARDMVDHCLNAWFEDTASKYHRLGVTLHTLSDTWAHKDFAGIKHRVNAIQLRDNDLMGKKSIFGDKMNELLGAFVSLFLSNTFPIGHGAALDYPDLPYLEWEYEDNDEIFIRKNYEYFLDTVDAMYRVLCCRFKRMTVPSTMVLTDARKDLLKQLFISFTDRDSYVRLNNWIRMLANGDFGFPPVELPAYKKSGVGSWRYDAFGGDDVYEYTPGYLLSDWKLFQDALYSHKYTVTRLILPKYGICVA